MNKSKTRKMKILDKFEKKLQKSFEYGTKHNLTPSDMYPILEMHFAAVGLGYIKSLVKVSGINIDIDEMIDRHYKEVNGGKND